MRTLKLLPLLVLFLGSVYSVSASPLATLDARKSLIEYAIQFEARGKVDVAQASFLERFRNFSFTSEAKAYVNGEACLILGFKSTFQNGLCRLSTAEGAQAYRGSCTDESLPCNPAVFGKGSGDQIFCAPAHAGNQLSKSCAFQTFGYLNEKAAGTVKGYDANDPSAFDLSKISFVKGDEGLRKAAETLFSAKDATLESAHVFVDQLCKDIAAGKKTGNQPQDLKTCLYYRGFLDQAKAAKAEEKISAAPAAQAVSPVAKVEPVKTAQDKPVTPAVEVKKEEKVSAPVQTAKADSVVDTVKAVSAPAKKEDCCTATKGIEAMPTQTTNQITSVIKQLGQKDSNSPQAWMTCIQALQNQKNISPEKSSRYWNQINGEKTFGMQCVRPKDDAYFQYAFLSKNGFSGVQYPRVRVTKRYSYGTDTSAYPSKVFEFKSSGKTYYGSVETSDMFNVVPESSAGSLKGTSATTAASISKEMELYRAELKHAGKTVDFNLTSDNGQPEQQWIKSCVGDRIADFVTFLMPMTAVPTAEQMVKDYNTFLPHNSPQFAGKYDRSIAEVKADLMAKVLVQVPDCEGIIDDKIINKAFQKNYMYRDIDEANFDGLHSRTKP